MPDQDTVRIEWHGKKGTIPRASLDRYLKDGAFMLPDQPKSVPRGTSPPAEEGFGSKLWTAANKPIGKDVNEKIRGVDQKMDDWLTMHLPEKTPNGLLRAVIQGVNIPGDIMGAVFEAGRQTLSPLGLATLGLASKLQALKASATAPKALKTAVGVAETGTGVGFGAHGIMEALRKRSTGEDKLEELQRRLSGLGQAMMGLTALGHAGGPAVEEGAKKTVRSVSNRGEKQVNKAASAAEKSAADKRQAFEESETKAKEKLTKDVAERERALIENSKLEGQRQSYESLQERLSKHTSDNLDRAEKMEKMALDADYEDFRKKILGVSKEAPNGTLQANLSPVGEAVLKAKETIIKGSQTNVPIFKDLMGRFSEMIDEAEGLKPAENQMLTADQLRGYVKELNDKIYASEVPSDVRNAMIHVRDVAERQISEAIKDVHGKAASQAYDALKDRYADYKETWFDKHSGSPVPKIRELLRAPVARNRGIPVYREVGDVLLGKDGEKIMAVLGRKRAFGADTKLIAQLRSAAEKLKSLPKPKGVPEVSPRKAGTPPEIEPFDRKGFIKEGVEKRMTQAGSFGQAFALLNAIKDVITLNPSGMLHSAETVGTLEALKRALTSGKFLDWVSKEPQ